MKPTTGLVALLTPLLLAGCGTEAPAAAPDPAPTASPTPTPMATPTTAASVTVDGPADLVELFSEREVAALPIGARTTSTDGTGIVARLAEDAGHYRLEVHNGPDVVSTVLADDADTPYLLDVQLELGQAGAGWVVGHEGGDSSRLQVFVVRAGRLVAAEPTPGDPPFGGGFTVDARTRRTWFDRFDRPVTSIATSRPDRVHLYGWEVSGPGEGGGGPDDLHPRLRADDLGVACVRESATRVVVRRC